MDVYNKYAFMGQAFFLQLNWKELLVGDEEWSFLLEIVLRAFIMIIAIVLALRILGKRGVKQLSIFELVVIISFGSAAGDPMIYKEIGVLTAMVVFTVIIAVYMLITYFIGRSQRFENIMEGQPICLISEGRFSINNFKKEALGTQELLSELRLKGISQLGQIEIAIEEISGEISVFYYEDEEVRFGLPIMPAALKSKQTQFDAAGYYSCCYCGFTEIKSAADNNVCEKCEHTEWLPSSNKKRVT